MPVDLTRNKITQTRETLNLQYLVAADVAFPKLETLRGNPLG